MIVMRATYEQVSWPNDDDEPLIKSGWTTPIRPGTYKWDDPPEEGLFAVQFDDIWDAAMFITNFHGEVWDYRDSWDADVDYATGVSTRYTLHVEDAPPFLFALADFIESRSNRPYAGPRRAGNKSNLVQIAAKDVEVGMLLDLEHDQYADPENLAFFASEYAEVMDVELETPKCIVLAGDGWTVGFPTNHILARTFTEEEEKRWLKWRP